MIFVTVGTHEQPMERLTLALEQLPRVRPDLAPFVVQYGYSRPPSGWEGHAFLSSNEMASLIQHARVIVTHGGAATIALCIEYGKVPIVVPRLKSFGEHVDDHQLAYARLLARRGQAVLVEDVGVLARRVGELADVPRTPTTVELPDVDGTVKRFAQIADTLVLRERFRRS